MYGSMGWSPGQKKKNAKAGYSSLTDSCLRVQGHQWPHGPAGHTFLSW